MANFYEGLAVETGSDIESNVSDVNPAEMAKMLQDLDDMDDDLFKMTRKQSEYRPVPGKIPKKATLAEDLSLQTGKQHVTFDEIPELSKKKEESMKKQDDDFDFDDPLGDILSSDESIEKSKTSTKVMQKKRGQDKANSVHMESINTALKDKSLKEKLVADLFGLENNIATGVKEQKNNSIKDSSVKQIEEPKSLESYLDKKSAKILSTSESDEINSSKVDLGMETIITKKKNRGKASSFDKVDHTESEDLLIGLGLESEKKTVNELFGKSQSRSIVDGMFTNAEKNMSTNGSKKDFNKQESSTEGMISFGNYAPSLPGTRESRRSGQKRETSIGDPLGLFSLPTTPQRNIPEDSNPKSITNFETETPRKKHIAETNKDDKTNWLGLSVNKEERVHPLSPEHKKNVEKNIIKSTASNDSVQHSSISLPLQSNSLPEWLGGTRRPSKQKEEGGRTSGYLDIKSIDPNVHQNIGEGIEPVSQGLTFQMQAQIEQEASYALQLQEQQLRAALQLRHHELQLSNVHERQRTLLQRQEEQMQKLLTQQTQRQKQLENQLQMQQKRIADYLQALMSQPSTPLLPNPVDDELPTINEEIKENQKEENVDKNREISLTDTGTKMQLMELQVALQQCELEKKALESTLYNLQIKLKEELHLMEDCYKRQICIMEEAMEKQNARLKTENERIEKEYEERLTKMQEQQASIIEKHAQYIKVLQEEHIKDMETLKAQHSALLEHVRNTQHIETNAVKEASQNMIILQSTMEQLGRNTDNLNEVQGWLEKQCCAQTELRELAIKTKEVELQAYKDNLARQREATEEERRKLLSLVEQLELQVAQQRSKAEEEQYTLRQETIRLDTRIEAFEREKERVKAEIQKERQHVEKSRIILLEEQKTVSLQLKEEKLSIAKEKARVQALAQFQGATAASEDEVVQLKAEAEAALTVAKDATDQVEAQKLIIQQQQRHLEKERHKLQELEYTLTLRARELEALTQSALTTRNEGVEALTHAMQAEERQKQQAIDLQKQLQEIKEREQRLAEERMSLSQERMKILRNRQKACPSCKGPLIKPMISAEHSQITATESNKYIDPKKVILKLVAEKERDALLNSSLHSTPKLPKNIVQ